MTWKAFVGQCFALFLVQPLPRFPSCSYPRRQWCGNAQGQEEPLEDRFMEYAAKDWGNTGYALMMRSILCDPRFELCDPEHAVRASTNRPVLRTAEVSRPLNDGHRKYSKWSCIICGKTSWCRPRSSLILPGHKFNVPKIGCRGWGATLFYVSSLRMSPGTKAHGEPVP